MEIEGTPRIIVWFAAPDVQFLNPATNILRRQFGNFDVIGMTGEQPLKITLEGKNIPFMATGVGTTFSLLPAVTENSPAF